MYWLWLWRNMLMSVHMVVKAMLSQYVNSSRSCKSDHKHHDCRCHSKGLFQGQETCRGCAIWKFPWRRCCTPAQLCVWNSTSGRHWNSTSSYWYAFSKIQQMLCMLMLAHIRLDCALVFDGFGSDERHCTWNSRILISLEFSDIKWDRKSSRTWAQTQQQWLIGQSCQCSCA